MRTFTPVKATMSVVDEGFICPYCLVGFASSGKLQSHFVEMHSGSETRLGWEGAGEVGATGGYGQLGDEVNAFVCMTSVYM